MSFLFLLACGFEPLSGTYLASLSNPNDTCGAEQSILDATQEDQEISVTVNETTIDFNGLYTLDRDGNTASYEEMYDEQNEPGLYTIQVLYAIDITWTKADLAEGTAGFEYTCTGDECDNVAAEAGVSLPCEAKYKLSMELSD